MDIGCGHCQAMAEDFRRLHKTLSRFTDDVVIAKVNADSEKELGKRFNIGGYPTLLWFPRGDASQPERYHGGRDFQSMLEYVQQHAGLKIDVPVEQRVSVDVDLKALEQHSRDKDIMLMVHAPCMAFYTHTHRNKSLTNSPSPHIGCGHCKSFKSHYEKVAIALQNEQQHCLVAMLDGNAHQDAAQRYSSECTCNLLISRFGIKGFPTLKFIKKGSVLGEGEDYTGPRDPETLIAWINERCGTHRRLDGTLTPEAGILADFEAIAKEILLTKSPKLEQYREQVIKLRSLHPGLYTTSLPNHPSSLLL